MKRNTNSNEAWNYSPPPNEEMVEVELEEELIEASAFYGRDGYRPHWRGRNGTIYDVSTFTRWRKLK